jgi:hypothetical protein
MIRAADDFKAIKERMQVIRNEIEMARAAENPPQPVDPTPASTPNTEAAAINTIPG